MDYYNSTKPIATLFFRSIFGVDWEERVQVIYAGDSAADEIAMEVLRGVAYTYKVIHFFY